MSEHINHNRLDEKCNNPTCHYFTVPCAVKLEEYELLGKQTIRLCPKCASAVDFTLDTLRQLKKLGS